MIDRILVAGYDAGIQPLLCLTKADLASPDAAHREYEPLGVPVDVVFPAPIWIRCARLYGHRSVFVGHSGVGKSTLVNALIPGADRAIGAVNVVTGRGRHISSSAIALRLPDSANSWVIGTPGVRSFWLSHVSRDRIIAAFDDLRTIAEDCPAVAATMTQRQVRVGRCRGERRSRPPGLSLFAGCWVPASSVGHMPVPDTARTGPEDALHRGLTDDLRLAHLLADDADSITMSRFRSLDLHVTSKPDLTPVSDADGGRAGHPPHPRPCPTT